MAVVAAVGSGIMQYRQAKEQEKQQKAYNQQVFEDTLRQYQELDKVEHDVVYESHAQSLQAQREYLQARSQIELNSAISGTAGNSIDLALHDLNTGLGNRMGEINFNRERELDNIDNQSRGLASEGNQRMDRSIHMPAWYQAGTSALGTYQKASGIQSSVMRTYKQAGTV